MLAGHRSIETTQGYIDGDSDPARFPKVRAQRQFVTERAAVRPCARPLPTSWRDGAPLIIILTQSTDRHAVSPLILRPALKASIATGDDSIQSAKDALPAQF